MRRALAIALLAVGLLGVHQALVACATTDPKTPQDTLELGTKGAEEQTCVDLDASLEAKTACVRAVRDRWCTAWRARFDAEVCP